MRGHHGRAPLRFATFLAPNMLPVYGFLADRIGQHLGRPVELVVGRSFDQFEQGEADLGAICGLPYVWLAARRPPPVEPLAAQVLAIELRDRPTLAEGLRVVGAFGPSTIQPVVAASRLPGPLKDQVRDLLVGLGDDPAARPVLDYGLIERFTPMGDADYDDIRAMLAAIEAAGWTSLTQRAVAP